MQKTSIFWFRRDLRLTDNTGLHHALKSGNPILPVFIFDKNILDQLENKKDRRVNFIYQAIKNLNNELLEWSSSLKTIYSSPQEAFKELVKEYNVQSVYTNHDYEPYARERDQKIREFLSEKEIDFKSYKDQCIFEKEEVVKDNGKPYTVFTPYSRKWKTRLNDFYVKSYPTEKYFNNFYRTIPFAIPLLQEIGFDENEEDIPTSKIDPSIIEHYKEQRDFPAIKGTSRLSVHLRFGTVSIRALTKLALEHNETWLNELIWRDFYMMILHHFPYVAKGAFKPQYDRIIWRNNEQEFKAWCEGKTGFPIVDAGMRELNATGFMHNRVRMITASFLVKDLLIDWRWGEMYFAEKLLDYDLCANNGGWQWAAGCGCDAAPYFRIFNPSEQIKKFDPKFEYIKQWVPEFWTDAYPEPMVNHAVARLRALRVYKEALTEDKQINLL